MPEKNKQKIRSKSKLKKTAIVLFNLGGPDNLQNVKPFLFNLFSDKHIITLPNPFRYLLAKFISARREKIAQEIYSHIGGRSPILEETKEQAKALKKKLSSGFGDFEVFISMRHWHPMSTEVTDKIKRYNPDEIILLPLYPQFSTTTSASSFEDFQKALTDKKITAPTKTICCYPSDAFFIKAHAELIEKSISKVKGKKNFRILFSAHGLPEKIVKSGDPYQWQVERTVKMVVGALGIPELDYKITYQSRVGPLKWLEPNTEDEIKKAGKEKKGLVIVPIAFVSEHVETLVELDIEYKKIADEFGIEYVRVPTLSVNKLFINSLADIVLGIPKQNESFIASSNGKRICPRDFSKCPCNGKKLAPETVITVPKIVGAKT